MVYAESVHNSINNHEQSKATNVINISIICDTLNLPSPQHSMNSYDLNVIIDHYWKAWNLME